MYTTPRVNVIQKPVIQQFSQRQLKRIQELQPSVLPMFATIKTVNPIIQAAGLTSLINLLSCGVQLHRTT